MSSQHPRGEMELGPTSTNLEFVDEKKFDFCLSESHLTYLNDNVQLHLFSYTQNNFILWLNKIPLHIYTIFLLSIGLIMNAKVVSIICLL